MNAARRKINLRLRQFWLNLQNLYDLEEQERKALHQAAYNRIQPYREKAAS